MGCIPPHRDPACEADCRARLPFSFVANWTNFFLPYVFLSDERTQPIQVGLSDLFRSSRPAIALATLVAAMPIAVVFIVSQRTLLRGLTGGSTNG